ncbi:MAG: AAA family ATPase [Erythrobacter sp.]
MTAKHVVLSGCSGGAKSTLLSRLGCDGFAIVLEPGRRIVDEELRRQGTALPWVNMVAFAERALELAAADRKKTLRENGWVFFDRGLVDAAVALQHATGRSFHDTLASFERYHERVFLTPPWPEIFTTDDSRQHGLADAIADYDRLLIAFRQLKYETIIVPKGSVQERADFVRSHFA